MNSVDGRKIKNALAPVNIRHTHIHTGHFIRNTCAPAHYGGGGGDLVSGVVQGKRTADRLGFPYAPGEKNIQMFGLKRVPGARS